MQKIKDERLILKNLKNIRLAFLIQSLGILLILFKDFFKHGNEIIKNPLWLLFVVTMTVLGFLSMNISIDYDRNEIAADKVITFGMIIVILISSLIVLSVSFTSGFNIYDGLLYGGILFICGLGTLLYV